LGISATIVAVLSGAALLLVGWFGHETRGRDLRELERPVKDVIWSGT
jgi:hypothetical protein